MRGTRLAAGVACASLAASVLAGCGEKKLDTAKAESAIRADIARQTGLGIESVRCPDEVEAKRGGRFRCVATARSGDRGSVRVTQRDDHGTVTWKLAGSR